MGAFKTWLLIAGCGLTIVVACNIAKKGDSSAPLANPTSADAEAGITPPATGSSAPLSGSWKAACQSTNVTGASSLRSLLVFQGESVINAEDYFSDSTCGVRIYTETTTGTYAMGEASTTVANATNLNLDYNQRTYTYLTAAAATAGYDSLTSSGALCSGVTPLLSGEVIDVTACVKDAGTLLQHVTFTLSDQNLVFTDGPTYSKQ